MWRFLSEFFRCVFISFIVTHHPSSCLGFLSFFSGVLLWFRVLGWWRPDVHPGLLVVDEVVQGDHRPHERGQVPEKEKKIDDRDQGQMLDGFFIPFP